MATFSKQIAVCILTTVHPPFDTRIFHKEAKTLVKAGYGVTLIVQHDRDTVVEGVRIKGLPKPRNRFTRIFGLTWRAFRLALRQRADVYHFQDPEILPWGWLLQKITHKPVIYDVHEDVPAQILTKHWIPAILRRPSAWLFGRWGKLAARFFDAVVVATEGIAERFSEHNPIVIHNYPDLEMLPPTLRSPATENERGLIYVGGISRLRGAVEMVDALAGLPHIDSLRLDLIGRFEPASLEAELQKMQGYQRVHFLGWLPWVSAWAYAQNALAGLVLFHPAPNHTNSLPNKLFEYMAAGLPVVASNFPLWKEIVEGNHCGLCVDPLNPKELAEAIEYLITHPEEARRMGENGRRAVLEKYNWETEGQKLLTLYEELLT